MFRPITDDSILRMEQLLLPAGHQFDQERRDIINCNHSVDVNACPGSGKTTVMLAKLLLLAEQMPCRDNQGICVLTHTNVAINEIKERLGLSDTVLFKYPNHFGTIQSFINKFLGIPGYIAKFAGKRPSVIDQDWYNAVIAKRYTSWNGTGKFWIQNKPDPVSLLQSYKFNSGFDTVLKKLNGDPVFQNNGNAFQSIFDFKMRILKDGILSYDDAYILAEYYINRFPRIKQLIRKRFPFLVIDEMQDTDTFQLSLLNQLFDPAFSTIQRIGDYNQAIFNKVSDLSVWSIGAHTLPLTGSKRFSPIIATQIDRVCITPRNMVGNPSIPDLQPRIILFSQDNIEQVIPHFGNTLIEINIRSLSPGPIKAVGWVKETEPGEGVIKNCIKFYWPPYSSVNRAVKIEYENLSEYLEKADEETQQSKGVSFYWQKIVLVFLRILRLAQIKTSKDSFYSKTSLLEKLKTHDEFYKLLQLNVIKWVKAIQTNDSVVVEVRDFINHQFLPIFDIQNSAEVNNFLNDANLPNVAEAPASLQDENYYNHIYSGLDNQHDGKDILIQVGTIHSVKGETHAATLCLETFYFVNDLKSILKYLKIGTGAPIPATQVRVKQALKMTYVAISRPSHYLCIAMRNDGISANDITELEAAGWSVDATLCN